MVNTELLNKAIDDSGLKLGFIIETLGISRQAFDKKRKGLIPFRASEVFVLCSLLNIPPGEKMKIFYPKVIENDNHEKMVVN